MPGLWKLIFYSVVHNLYQCLIKLTGIRESTHRDDLAEGVGTVCCVYALTSTGERTQHPLFQHFLYHQAEDFRRCFPSDTNTISTYTASKMTSIIRFLTFQHISVNSTD